jgi:hypothetical protein
MAARKVQPAGCGGKHDDEGDPGFVSVVELAQYRGDNGRAGEGALHISQGAEEGLVALRRSSPQRGFQNEGHQHRYGRSPGHGIGGDERHGKNAEGG